MINPTETWAGCCAHVWGALSLKADEGQLGRQGKCAAEETSSVLVLLGAEGWQERLEDLGTGTGS